MSEYTDAEIAEEESKALDGQIAELLEHHYSVERKLWKDRKGNPHMSDYWRIHCSCGWKGTRIRKPGREESKGRVREWEAHIATSR